MTNYENCIENAYKATASLAPQDILKCLVGVVKNEYGKATFGATKLFSNIISTRL